VRNADAGDRTDGDREFAGSAAGIGRQDMRHARAFPARMQAGDADIDGLIEVDGGIKRDGGRYRVSPMRSPYSYLGGRRKT